MGTNDPRQARSPGNRIAIGAKLHSALDACRRPFKTCSASASDGVGQAEAGNGLEIRRTNSVFGGAIHVSPNFPARALKSNSDFQGVRKWHSGSPAVGRAVTHSTRESTEVFFWSFCASRIVVRFESEIFQIVSTMCPCGQKSKALGCVSMPEQPD